MKWLCGADLACGPQLETPALVLDQLAKVIFSDNSTVQQFVTTQRHVWKLRGRQFENCYTKHQWNPIQCNGLGGKVIKKNSWLPKGLTMYGSRYLELITEKLEIHVSVLRCNTFMHVLLHLIRPRYFCHSYKNQGPGMTRKWSGSQPN